MSCVEIRRALAGEPADAHGFLCLADAIEGVRQLRAGFVSPEDRRLLVRYLESEELRCANQRDQNSPWLVTLRRIKQVMAPVEFVRQAEAAAVSAGELPAEEATVRVMLPAPPPKALIDAMTVLGWREPTPCDGVGDPIVRHGMPAGPALVAGGQGRTGEETGRRCGWWCVVVIGAALWIAAAVAAKALGLL